MRYSREIFRSVQTAMVEYLKNTFKCGIFLAMGGGKTIVVLTAIADLLDELKIIKVLVIAPKRVCQEVWPQEIKKWEHVRHLTYSLVEGNKNKQIRALNTSANIHIISIDLVRWLVEYYGRNWPFDMVVIDESSNYKDRASKRFKALRKVCRLFQRLVLMTGTPASNSLLDLWSQAYLVDQGKALGKTITAYRKAHFDVDYHGYNWTIKSEEHEKIIYDKVKPIFKTATLEDYDDLPKEVHNVIKVNLPSQTMIQYRELEQEKYLKLVDGEVAAINSAVLTNKLQQYANGAIYKNGSKEWLEVHEEKLNALGEIIDELYGEPVLVSYYFTFDLLRIIKRFKGAVSITEPNAIDRWNNGEIPILLIHPKSAGYGLNLQFGGNNIVWYGPIWPLGPNLQLNARLTRPGQANSHVFVHYLIAKDTVDETIYKSLGMKNRTQQNLINALKQDIKERVGS